MLSIASRFGWGMSVLSGKTGYVKGAGVKRLLRRLRTDRGRVHDGQRLTSNETQTGRWREVYQSMVIGSE